MGWTDVGMKQMWSLSDSSNHLPITATPDGEELRGSVPTGTSVFPESAVPHYSTSIEAAWAVVEKLLTVRDTFMLGNEHPPRSPWEVEAYDFGDDEGNRVAGGRIRQAVIGHGDPPAEAICRAALAAVTEEGK